MNPVSALQRKANNSPYYQYLGLQDSSHYCSAADEPKNNLFEYSQNSTSYTDQRFDN